MALAFKPIVGPNGIIVKNWSCTDTIVHKTHYIWMIRRYSFYDAKGEDLKSPIFASETTAEIKWHLLLKPNGYKTGKSYISAYLYLDPSSKHNTIYAEYKLSILDSQQKEVISDENGKVCKFVLGTNQDNWGTEILIRKEDLFNDELSMLPNDTLTIYCGVRFSHADVFITNFSSSFQADDVLAVPLPVPVSSLSEDFGLLFQNRAFADVVLSTNEKRFPVHKAILSARSPVFAAMFKHDKMKDGDHIVEIPDIDEETLEDMLRYIYTEKCEHLEELAYCLIMAADKYNLDGLKVMCEKELLKTLSVENAIDRLVLADMYRAKELRAKTINFIVANSAKVMNTKEWKSLSRSNCRLVMDLCEALSHQMNA
ncbi:protein roadkill-like [Planococcus citri]|uniref:protein roadkill-like n=1 Tax=Planococcus citri TaxID=170843 RepID=UPI0031F8A9B4